MSVEKKMTLRTFTERDIPRFNKATLLCRWMDQEDKQGSAFCDNIADLELLADKVMELYVETGHRQQNPMMFK
jgi:hypothetical protein